MSIQNKLYTSFLSKQARMFPHHTAGMEGIGKESLSPPEFAKKISFKGRGFGIMGKCPKLNEALSKVARKSDLSFEDAGPLKDAMDRKTEDYLKKSWNAGAANFQPAIASTCEARTLDLWLKQIKILLKQDTP